MPEEAAKIFLDHDLNICGFQTTASLSPVWVTWIQPPGSPVDLHKASELQASHGAGFLKIPYKAKIGRSYTVRRASHRGTSALLSVSPQ